jgi:hypothetical protein
MGGMGFIHTAECEILRNSALINIHMTNAAAQAEIPRYFFLFLGMYLSGHKTRRTRNCRLSCQEHDLLFARGQNVVEPSRLIALLPATDGGFLNQVRRKPFSAGRDFPQTMQDSVGSGILEHDAVGATFCCSNDFAVSEGGCKKNDAGGELLGNQGPGLGSVGGEPIRNRVTAERIMAGNVGLLGRKL